MAQMQGFDITTIPLSDVYLLRFILLPAAKVWVQLAGPIPGLSEDAIRVAARGVDYVSLTIGGGTETSNWTDDMWCNVERVAMCCSRMRLLLHHPTIFSTVSEKG